MNLFRLFNKKCKTMKKIYYIFLLLVLSSLVFINCEKDDEKDEKISPSMTATVDGEEWVATSNLKAHYHTDEYLELNGSVSSSNAIDININATTTGTYDFQGSYESKAIYTKSVGGIPKAYTTEANSGQVTITEFSTSVVKGTFNFNAYGTYAGQPDTIVVENGAFTLEYTSN
jgi:hypothetical protein